MSDEQFTKITGSLLTSMRGLLDWGIEGGHTTQDEMRMTVATRKKVVAALCKQGMSQRQIAKELGVSQETARRDLLGHHSSPVTQNASKATRNVSPVAKVFSLVKKLTLAEREELLAKIKELADIPECGE
jgi:predicted transcriptional regulator